jgi:hypothetical protein
MQSVALPRLAAPTLASSLLDRKLDGLVDAGFLEIRHASLDSESPRIGTGVRSVDDALGGGLRGGRVVCVSAEAGGSGNDVGFRWTRFLSRWHISILLLSPCSSLAAHIERKSDVLTGSSCLSRSSSHRSSHTPNQ